MGLAVDKDLSHACSAPHSTNVDCYRLFPGELVRDELEVGGIGASTAVCGGTSKGRNEFLC